MTEISGTPPPSPRVERAPKGPERVYTREQVLKTFNDSFEFFKSDPSLSDVEQWAVQSIQTAKANTLDKGRATAENKFSNSYSGQEYTTREGVPVDKLIGHLTKKIESGSLKPGEKRKLEEWRSVLSAHSKPLLRGKQLESGLRFARNQQEAYLIDKDARNAGDVTADWYKAESELSERRELVLPPKTKEAKVTAPEPPVVPEPPVEPPIPTPTPEPPIPTLIESPIVEEPPVPSGEVPVPPAPVVETPVPPAPIGEIDPPIPPAPPVEGPRPPTPPTVEDKRYQVAIVNRTVDLKKRAREVAEEHLREKLKGRNIFRRIRYRVAEEYYRQKFTDQAYKAMLANGNSYLSMENVKSSLHVDDANHGRTYERDAGVAKIEEMRLRDRLQLAQGTLKNQLLQNIIQPVIDGRLTNQQDVQRALAQFMSDNAADPMIAQLFGKEANVWQQSAEYFATDLLEMGNGVREDYAAHGKSMEWLQSHIDIQLANAQWAAATEPQKLSRTDRFVRWAQNGRIRSKILNPAAIGALSSIATFGILRVPLRIGTTAASIAAPGAGALSGGIFAAWRRNYDLKMDMASHRTERAYNMQVPEGSNRREKLERYAYDTVSVKDLLQGGGTDRQREAPRRSVSELMTSDLSVEANQIDLVSRIAEIQERLDFSDANGIDLITYSSRETVEQGRLALVKAVVDAKIALREAGLSDERVGVMRNTLKEHFEQDQAEKDKGFKRYRVRSSLANGAFGSAVGLGMGLGVQEGMALGMRASGHGAGQTILERMVGYEGSKPRVDQHITDFFGDLGKKGGSFDASWETRFTVDPSTHLVHITDIPSGKSLVDAPITMRADGTMFMNGKLPPEVQAKLQASQFQLIDRTGPPIEVSKTIEIPGAPTRTTEIVSGPGSVEQWHQVGTHFDQQEWYGNNTSGVYELNELKAYTIKQGDTLVLDMSKMQMASQNGLSPNPISVQNVIQNGEAGFSFRLPGMDHQTIWIPDKADGVADGLLHLNPNDTTHFVVMGDGSKMSIGELSKMIVNQDALAKFPDGDIATEYYNRREVFNLGLDGKKGWWEPGRMVEQNGRMKLQTFATGRGISDAVGVKVTEIPGQPTTQVITETIPGKPSMDLIPPKYAEYDIITYDAPPIIPLPFAPRHPLEKLDRPRVPAPPPPEYFGYPLEYGLAYEVGFGASSVEGYTSWLKRSGFYPTEQPYVKRDGKWVHADGAEIKRDPTREKEAIKRYLDQQPAEHRAMVEGFADRLAPMDENCRVAIIMPAYLEGKNIYHTLEEWKNQFGRDGQRVDPSLYEIDIIVNGPSGYTPDNTVDEIERFKAENPEMRINYINLVVPDKGGNVGRVRKIITDIALERSVRRTGGESLYIESEDADLLEIDRNAVANLIQRFDERPHVDALRGKQDLSPTILMENDLLFYDRRAERFIEYLLRDYRLRPDNNEHFDFYWNRNITGGWNTAFTAEAYALIGGYQPAQVGEDVDIGRRISVMRGNKNEKGELIPNVNTIESIHNTGQSNPRRFIHALLKKQPAYADFTNEEANREIRERSNQEMIAALDYGKRISSENIREFEDILTRARQFLGWKVKDPKMQEIIFKRLTYALGFKKYKVVTNPDGSSSVITGGLKQEGPDKDQWKDDFHIEPDGRIVIDNIENIKSALESYRQSHVPYGGLAGAEEGNETPPPPTTTTTATTTPSSTPRSSRPSPTRAETDVTIPPTTNTTRETTTPPARRETAGPKSLEDRIRDTLTASSSSAESSYAVGGAEVLEFFTKELTARGGSIEGGKISMSKDMMKLGGKVKASGGSSEFDVTLVLDESNKLKVLAHTVSSSGSHKFAKGRIEDYVREMPKHITDQINTRLPEGWEVDGYELNEGNLNLKFKKKSDGLTPTPAEKSIDFKDRIEAGKGAMVSEADIFHPDVCEDSVVVNTEKGFLGVFDGVGGHAAGDTASRIAMENTRKVLGALPFNPTPDQLHEAVKQILTDTYNDRTTYVKDHPESAGMATTGTIAKVFEEGGKKKLMVLHAGDSRLYAVRKDGSIKQITTDHSTVYEAVRNGHLTAEEGERILAELDELREISTDPEERKKNTTWQYFLKRNVIAKVFAQGEAPDYNIYGLSDEVQYVFATSDGVHDNLTKTQIEEICKGAKNPEELASTLVQRAKEISRPSSPEHNIRSKSDDITVAVLRV